MSGHGYLKLWRRALWEDLWTLDAHEFKLWAALQALAQHRDFKTLERGELHTTYEQLRERLAVPRDDDPERSKTYSQHTLQACLRRLEALGYITILLATRGKRLHIRIERYDELQGDTEFSRYLDYPPESDDKRPY